MTSLSIAVGFVVAWIFTGLLVYFERVHLHVSSDHTDSGPQKFHARPTPRIGGVALLGGGLAGAGLAAWFGGIDGDWLVLFAVALLPVWGAGMLEDVTKRVGPRVRLLSTFVAAGLGIWLLDARLERLDLPWVDDWLAAIPLLSVALTLVAAGGISHAINIIDGFNGLAGAVVIFVLCALGWVCHQVGDGALMLVCLSFAAATLGFLLWNYPRGAIFAGDGGAYLWGFVIAEVSVLLVRRHPEVSAWFPMLLVAYPVWETLFSVWRRRFFRKHAALQPDSLHLHQLIFRRVVGWTAWPQDQRHLLRRNSLTSPYLWAFQLAWVAPAVAFWRSTGILVFFAMLFIVTYNWLYARIVRFRTPGWLARSQVRARSEARRRQLALGGSLADRRAATRNSIMQTGGVPLPEPQDRLARRAGR
ncbi:MAG: glycosyl transferase [Betaproteobacteria bacterium]|nr:glycosyl transferase [Betaproteobacteria bacterium]